MNLMARRYRSPSDRALFGMLSVFSEFERSMIRVMAVRSDLRARLQAARAELAGEERADP